MVGFFYDSEDVYIGVQVAFRVLRKLPKRTGSICPFFGDGDEPWVVDYDLPLVVVLLDGTGDGYNVTVFHLGGSFEVHRER